MPDRNGIERFSGGAFGCAWCQAARLSYVEAEEHRRKCGPSWRATYGARRGKTDDERLVEEAIRRGMGEAA
jgi:hypothetical protein